MGSDVSRESKHVEHIGVETFQTQLIASLRLVRAALLYFVEMILINEAAKKREIGKVVEIPVHSHHYIRGQE